MAAVTLEACLWHDVRRLMRLMRLVPIYQEPNTSKKHPAHKIYPYLLKGLANMLPLQAMETEGEVLTGLNADH